MKVPPIVWIEPEQVTIPADLVEKLGNGGLLARSLASRGILSYPQAQAFLDPRHYQPGNAADLPDLNRGLERIQAAIDKKEQIGIWGDFDVDGQTATTLLVAVLQALGAKVAYHIPVRATESHGINLPGLIKMIDAGAQVILTCDTGISAHDAAAYCHSHGVDLVITDHHSLPATLPDALAVINPQRLPPGHPLGSLPGVGTAYVFARELCARADRQDEADRHLDLVALGTVADLAILKGDARYQVQLGLEQLRNPQRPGLVKLLELAEVDPAHLSEEHIGFFIAPRLNAIGRLGDANPVVNFLTTRDAQAAAVFAAQLEGLNAERRFLTEQVFQAALKQIEQEPGLLDSPVLVLHHPEWPAGINGIVASRLVELFYRPAILLTSPPGQAMRGSARSIEGIHITAAIAATADLLEGYGGHPMAAGLALQPHNLPAFRRRLATAVESQVGETKIERRIQIDAYLDLADISLEQIAEIDRLAPFGPGNPSLILATRNLHLVESAPIGKNQDHLMAIVEDESGQSRRVIWWQGARNMLPGGRFDLAYSLRTSNYRGQLEVQIEWQAARIIEEKPAEISRPSQIEWVDCRNSSSSLDDLLKFTEAVVWAEGRPDLPITAYDRFDLPPGDTLVIWTAPPGRRELITAIQKVRPQKIILFDHNPFPDKPRLFLETLIGMLRYGLAHNLGRVNLEKLAAILGQRVSTIGIGLRWLVARGYVRLVEQNPTEWVFAEGGVPVKASAEQLELELRTALEETSAFRAFYHKADPAHLLP